MAEIEKEEKGEIKKGRARKTIRAATPATLLRVLRVALRIPCAIIGLEGLVIGRAVKMNCCILL